MLRNPLQLRLEKLEPWKQMTFMACLCERMYPNYAMFCEHTHFASPKIFRDVLDIVWESLTVKNAKVNFERQLEKIEEIIPNTADFDLYAVYPAVDACQALSTLIHSQLDRDTLLESAIEVSSISVQTVAQLETSQTGIEVTDQNQKENQAVCEEWDIQWAIYRPLKESPERETQLIKDLRDELKTEGVSNIGIQR